MTARPNIVLILADDMGYGDFGCFNYGASRTPRSTISCATASASRSIILRPPSAHRREPR